VRDKGVAEEMVVLASQVCQISTWAIYEDMLFILPTVPVASIDALASADSELIRSFVLLLLETLNIQVVTRESESGKVRLG